MGAKKWVVRLDFNRDHINETWDILGVVFEIFVDIVCISKASVCWPSVPAFEALPWRVIEGGYA